MLQTEKCSIAKIIKEENSICNPGEIIFVCAATLIMRFLYSRKEIVSFNVKARIYRFLNLLSICTKCYTP